MPRLNFQTPSDWQQAIEQSGISIAPDGVRVGTGQFQLADDFQDGVRDAKWVTHLNTTSESYSAAESFDSLATFNYANLNVSSLFGDLAQAITLASQANVSTIWLPMQEINLYDVGPGTGVRLEIQTLDVNGKPSGTVLASKTKWIHPPAGEIQSWWDDAQAIGGGWYWLKFTLPSPVNLNAGQYALVLRAIYPESPFRFASWGGATDNSYAGGKAWRFDKGANEWRDTLIPVTDFYFKIYTAEVVPDPHPFETEGRLVFRYSPSAPGHKHALYNQDLTDIEAEFRLNLRLFTEGTLQTGTGEFALGILQGDKILTEDTAWKNKAIWELIIQWENSSSNRPAAFKPVVYGADGNTHVLGSASWPLLSGSLVRDASNITFEVDAIISVKKGVSGGIIVKATNPFNTQEVLFESTESPAIRTLSGSYFLELGPQRSDLINGGLLKTAELRFDYFNLFLPIAVSQGFLRLRHSFGVPTTLSNFEMKRSLPAAGDRIEVRLRSGNTVAELEAASFGSSIATQSGSFDPGNPQNQFEKALLNIPQAKFFETKLTLIAASPSPILEGYFLEFSVGEQQVIVEEKKPTLTYRRHIQSNDDWAQAVEKSASIRIEDGTAKIAPVFQDLFDQFVIEPHWEVYQRNANAFASLGFLRMEILSTDSDAILVKKSSIPTSFKATVRWKVDNPFALPVGTNFFFNVFAIYNKPSLPTTFDIRFGGSPSSDTHHTIIIRWSRTGDGQHRLGLVALRNDGTFVGWNQATGQWSPAAGDQIIPSGKEATLWTFEVEVAGGGLVIKAKDDEGAIRFQTSSLPIKIFDSQPWMVLGDSDSSFMPANTTQLYDSVETDIPVTGASSGFIRFRDSLGAKGRLGKIKVLPTVNIQFDPGEVILKARSGDTLEELLASSFKETSRFVPNVNGNDVSLAVAPGSLIEVELVMFSASPGPEIQFLSWEIEPLIEDNPVIFSLDPITSEAQAVASGINTGNTSEGQASAPLAFDGDPTTQWESTSGQEGFNVIWFYTLHLKKNGQPFEETIDSLIFLNTNIGSIQVELHRLGFSQSKVVFKGEILTPDAIIRFDPFPVALIEIQIFSSQVPNEKKKIGEILAGSLLLALPGFDRYEPKRELVESGQMRALGGKLIVFRGRDKYSSRWQATQLPQELKDQILKVFRENPLVTFWPEPKFMTRDFFDVAWRVEEITFPYTDVVKGAGHTLESEMTEV
ncbi:MAG: hypothetical protein HY401_04090 [Elusimicrobia bacterium]|nr:hypothetical protein [Elusimicrobiota bacterium]